MRAVSLLPNINFLSFLALVSLLLSTLLLNNAANSVVAAQDIGTKVYIVYMGERKHRDVELITDSHHEMLASVLGSKEAAIDSMIYSYKHGFSGFAAKMTKTQAQAFSELPGVVEVIPNQFYKVRTTRSWDFLGLSPTSSAPNLLHDADQGEGAIIGVIDGGVWPESESFSDKGIGKIPAKWKGHCEAGAAFDPAKHCNNKIIGARYFIKGFLAALDEPFNATESGDILSPRDSQGHGSHCASIAAGSFVSNVSLNGLAHGTLHGGAPRARLAIYKATWLGGGVSADILKAFDEAIHDGVDVLSVSLGFDYPLYPETERRDLIYYGAFHAVSNGITVVCSGGNEGPSRQTVEDVAPWVITVAASTIDRSFPTPITLGNKKKFVGQSMYYGKDTSFLELVHKKGTDVLPQSLCEDLTENDTWVAGKVVLCFNKGDEVNAIQAANVVNGAGGLGFIAAIDNVDFYSTYYTDFPCILVSFDVGTQILNYIRSTRDPKVKIMSTKTYTGDQVSTYIASFSSRGPNSLSPSVLKVCTHQFCYLDTKYLSVCFTYKCLSMQPDIAAPGVDILAAYVPSETNKRGYRFDSGTSMAAPHIAGIVTLLKSLHPHWSPAAVRSALVTTAWTHDPHTGEPIYAKAGIYKMADPFDYGGGIVNPSAASHPGLVYDMGKQDYVDYLCAMGYNETAIDQLTGKGKSCRGSNKSVLDLNLPSITVPNLRNSVTVTRTVTNVGDPNSMYSAVVSPPAGTSVKVNPSHLHFSSKVREMSFTVTITTFHKVTTEYYFGSLTWTDNIHTVKIPISVKTVFPQVYNR
ncbi:subtilisin-like protease SBT3.3 isoform X2 [Andrographis paniculata]|uniref:subtilisin-like protease SBT3.3 isoform X2 n=1 Tax=Andrographis paniculata TaxID=175694 RepID=UPI0021E844B6|nr:subtilisin-like protease SBT3.3 isoform X2 [Andrographis paniculata]